MTNFKTSTACTRENVAPVHKEHDLLELFISSMTTGTCTFISTSSYDIMSCTSSVMLQESPGELVVTLVIRVDSAFMQVMGHYIYDTNLDSFHSQHKTNPWHCGL